MKNTEHLGTPATVLWENDIDGQRMHGFTENYIRVTAQYDPLKINDTQRVTLIGITTDGHVEVVEQDEVLTH